jgi:cytochrome c oxidase subunit IV
MNASRTYRRLVGVWLALILLLLATWGSAYLKLGAWNGVVNMIIATVKVLLVALFFMHLKSGTALIRLFAVIALFALTLLFTLSGSDYATRTAYRASWQVPQQLPGPTIAPR